MNTLLLRTFLLVTAISLPAWGIAAGALQLRVEAMQEVETVGKDGSRQKKTVPVAKAVPGSEVIYVITYKNTGSQPVEKAVIDNPLPKELIYLAGSAAGEGASFLVSVDGGATFGVLPSLEVPGADGKPRPARATDVTHLRWELSGTVAPGAKGSVTYRAILK